MADNQTRDDGDGGAGSSPPSSSPVWSNLAQSYIRAAVSSHHQSSVFLYFPILEDQEINISKALY